MYKPISHHLLLTSSSLILKNLTMSCTMSAANSMDRHCTLTLEAEPLPSFTRVTSMNRPCPAGMNPELILPLETTPRGAKKTMMVTIWSGSGRMNVCVCMCMYRRHTRKRIAGVAARSRSAMDPSKSGRRCSSNL